ncbi:MAG: methionine--tRNA ligase [Nitrospira sp.]
MSKNFYITTTLPYVNSDPHIGFAMEIIRADIVARAKEVEGFDVFFNTGTDEHGQKIFDNAQNAGVSVQSFVDEKSQTFRNLKDLLGLKPDLHFVRTTDEHHIKSAQEFWMRCFNVGDIYKKNYKVKYCVGCELEKQDSDLENGVCPLHPNKELEIREEENYFFRFSKYQKPLLDFYKENPNFVIPDFRFNEIKAFVERGLLDFSISRQKSKMSWGVEVPNDPDHVMYVWFDALVNYVSTLGWPENIETFEKYWVNGAPVQYCGKDNLRQQSAMWQAMLMSAGLPNSKHIIINGFIQSDGQKMSKSLGNVIDPKDLVAEYGTDALRYFVAREVSSFEDSDVTLERFKDSYNGGLANGLGNLVSRVMKMAEVNLENSVDLNEERLAKYLDQNIKKDFYQHIDSFEINKALDIISRQISAVDLLIQTEHPFKVVKTDPEKGKQIITDLVFLLFLIADLLKPILPETSEKIKKLIKENKAPETPLFLRKD